VNKDQYREILDNLQASNKVLSELALRISGLEARIKGLEQTPESTMLPRRENLNPIKATKFLHDLSSALTHAQTELLTQTGPNRFAVGAVKTQIRAHLDFDEENNITMHLPRPDLGVIADTLTSMELSFVPLGAPESEVQEEDLLVPSVVGQPEALACRQIESSGFSVSKINYVEHKGAPGRILEQSPMSGATMRPGAEINLTVSQSSDVLIPSLVGSNIDDAKQVLDGHGLQCQVVTQTSDTVSVDTVIEQDPQSESAAKRGSIVKLVVAEPAATKEPLKPSVRRKRRGKK